MATVPAFDQTITADGLTVRVHRVGEKLIVELTDPAGALRELEVLDKAFVTTVVPTVTIGARARSQSRFERMFAALDKMSQIEVDRIIAGLPARGALGSESFDALHQVVAQTGRIPEWTAIKYELRETFAHRRLERNPEMTSPFLAAAFRDLIGTGPFTGEHYDLMTHSWRVLVGRIHPEDVSLKEEPTPLPAR